MKKTLVWAFISIPAFMYSQINTTPRIKLPSPPVENKEKEYREKGIPMEREFHYPLAFFDKKTYHTSLLKSIGNPTKAIILDKTLFYRVLQDKKVLNQYGR